MPALPRPPSANPSHHPVVLLLATLGLLAGCATRPGGESATLGRWTQLGPDGSISLRAIVGATADCPIARVDGSTRPLVPRARATPAGRPADPAHDNRAFQPGFAVTSCELGLPASTRQASIDGQPVPMPGADPQRIVVVGDTGCRIKVPASGPADPIQDCASPADWPWQRIATAAAHAQPDLVIHLGDYHYREYCDNPALCASLNDRKVVIGYGWDGWDADFFTPAAVLLTAAPWIVVRGNHENCDRGGEGWMRFLSPLPYQPCPNQTYKSPSQSVLANNLTANAYRIDLGQRLTLVVADNAAFPDYLPASATAGDVAIFERTLARLHSLPARQPAWLLIHKPLWYDLLPASAPPNALQSALHGRLPAGLQFVFAGHEHAFETINFAPAADPVNHPAGRPAQLIVGTGGTQLEAFDPLSPFYEGGAPGSKESAQPGGRLHEGVAASSGIVLNRYGFLLLERHGEAWTGRLMDADGQEISHCRLNGEAREAACTFPARP